MIKKGQDVGSNFRREDLDKVYSQTHQHGQPLTMGRRDLVQTFPDNSSIYSEKAIFVVLLVDTDTALSISKCELSFLFLHTVDHAQLFIPRGESKGLRGLLK